MDRWKNAYPQITQIAQRILTVITKMLALIGSVPGQVIT